jgi:hypothetical protein
MFSARTASVFLVTTALVLCSSRGARADTYVSGTLTGDTTWTVAGSPFIVTSASRFREKSP